MKKLFIPLVFLFISLGLNAQEKFLKDVQETQELSIKIIELFEKKKIPQAFELITLYWPMPQNEIVALEDKSIKYLNLIEDRFGKAIGIMKIKNETISDIAIRETYLIQHENTALRFIFTYYKNNEGWIVNAFKWDDSFDEEFK